MNLNNVFYGFTKEGKYRVLWKKYRVASTSLGDVTYTIYYDLEENKEIDSFLVDVQTLKPITDIVGDKKRMGRKKVINAFSINSNVLLDVQGAFYGDVISKKKMNNTQRMSTELRKNILFARIGDPEGRSMEVKTGCLYPRAEHTLKGVCVRESRPIKRNQFDDVVAPKRKLLEMDYRKEL